MVSWYSCIYNVSCDSFADSITHLKSSFFSVEFRDAIVFSFLRVVFVRNELTPLEKVEKDNKIEHTIWDSFCQDLLLRAIADNPRPNDTEAAQTSFQKNNFNYTYEKCFIYWVFCHKPQLSSSNCQWIIQLFGVNTRSVGLWNDWKKLCTSKRNMRYVIFTGICRFFHLFLYYFSHSFLLETYRTSFL